MNLNKIQIIGRITKDPELKSFDSGVQVCSFSIATNHIYKNKAGEKIEEVEFHNITAFGKVAETIAKYVTKGQELYVCGRVKTNTWEKDGQKHYRTGIILETFQFGAKPKDAPKTQETKSVKKEETFESYIDQDQPSTEVTDDIKAEDIPF